jgi:hypothetical protein
MKLLADLRGAGVNLLYLYQDKEFKTNFLRHPNELAMIFSKASYFTHISRSFA